MTALDRSWEAQVFNTVTIEKQTNVKKDQKTHKENRLEKKQLKKKLLKDLKKKQALEKKNTK